MRRAEERCDASVVLPPIQGVRGVKRGKKDETLIQIEETKAAIRDSVERAKELIIEARFVMNHTGADAADPPNQIR